MGQFPALLSQRLHHRGHLSWVDHSRHPRTGLVQQPRIVVAEAWHALNLSSAVGESNSDEQQLTQWWLPPAPPTSSGSTGKPTCSKPAAAADVAIVLLRLLAARAAVKGWRGAQELGAAHCRAEARTGAAAAAAARRERPAAVRGERHSCYSSN